ncbi:MAG TPA: VOC family protein [Iamia sp.]|nr:VOC family protein [Iamia sp.]
MSDRPRRRLSHVVVDCIDPEGLADFWTATLGVEVDHRFGPYVFLAPTVPGGPALAFQRVPDPTPGKNRLHLDLVTDQVEAVVAELLASGARHIRSLDEDGLRLEVLADPEGNEFCIVHHV